MCFFLWRFDSHQKALWLICLLAVGPGSTRILPEELFSLFLGIEPYRMPENQCVSHHPQPAPMSQAASLGLLRVTFASSLWYQLNDTRKREM